MRFVATAFAAGALFLMLASSASALSYGINFRSYDTGDLEIAQHSGATVYRVNLDYACTGGYNWGQFDPIVKAAWERGITILPILLRSNSCTSPTQQSFLLSTDPEWGAWGAWARAVVERYGTGGSFWAGKSSPTPITAWEVGNEPNLAQNNPGGTKVQPANYGKFLEYTAGALQEGAKAKTGTTTQVLSAGLYMQGGYYYGSFLQEMGASGSYTGVAIHPYSFINDFTGLTENITNVRYLLDHNIPGGTSKSLWITEMGWAVPPGSEGLPGGGGHTVSEEKQAALLNQSFEWIKSVATADKISLVTWYKIQDQSESGTHWDEHTGLRRFDGSYRLAWYAFETQTGAPEWPVKSPSVANRAFFSDASNNNTIADWTWNSSTGWQQLPLWGHTIAAGTSPATLMINGQPNVFYVDASNGNTITDWTWNSTTGWQQQPFWGHTVAKGTSPVATTVNGEPSVFYVDASNGNTISEWKWNSTTGWQQQALWGHTVAAGTSPTAMIANGKTEVFYVDATDGNTVTEWSWNSTTGWQQQFLWGHSLAAGTSPAAMLVTNPSAIPEVFYVDAATNTINVWTWNSSTGWQQGFLGGHTVMKGSSPAPMMVGAIPEVFFADANNSNSITAWVWNSLTGWQQGFLYGHAVAAGTSPKTAMNGSTPNVFFVDASDENTITEWTWNSTTGWQPTYLWGHPVSAGSSPGVF
jgi:hypothetical protein